MGKSPPATVQPEADPSPSLSGQRLKLLNSMLRSSVIVGTALFALAVFYIFTQHLSIFVLVLFSIIYLWTILITWFRRLPFWLRVNSFLFLLYALGLVILAMSGFTINAGLFLLSFVAMAAVYHGLRGGLLAFVLTGITLVVVGWLVVDHQLTLYLVIPESNPWSWILGSLIYLLIGILFATSATSLVGSIGVSEEYYRALIEHSNDLTILLERSGVIRYVSPSVKRMFGYSPVDLVGRSIFELVHPEDHKLPMDALAPSISPEQIGETIELRALHRDGSWRWLEVHGQAMYDHPAVHGAVVNAHDITERKRTEQMLQQAHSELEERVVARTSELQRAEVRYEHLYQTMRDGFVQVDMEGHILFCNQVYLEMLGYSLEEIRQKTSTDLTPKKWHARQQEIIDTQVLPRGYSELYEKEYIRKDGSLFPIELRNILLRDDAGQPTGMWAFVHDITERKLTLDALHEREQLNNAILEATQLFALVIERDGKIVTVNEHAARHFNRTIDELIGTCCYDLLPPESAAAQRKKVETVFSSGQPMLFEDCREGRWYENRIFPILNSSGEVNRAVILSSDITERRQAEQALMESEARYRTLAETAPDMIFIVDRNDTIQYLNSFAASYLGEPIDQVLGQPRSRFFPDPIEKRQYENLQQVAGGGRPLYIESENKFKGRVVWLGTWLVPLRASEGEVTGIMGISRDVTDRIRAEQALRESEERYRTLAEAAPEMIYILDREEILRYVNSYTAKTFGVSREQMIGRHWSEVTSPPAGRPGRHMLGEVLETGQPVYVEGEYHLAGRSIWLGSWLVPLRDSSEQVTSVLGISRDITDRKVAELALVQARDQLEQRVQERTAELEASQSRLKQLAEQVINTQEQERRGISRELHDEAGQMLITLKYSLMTCLNELPQGSTVSRASLEEALATLDSTIHQVRNLAHSLRPPALDVGGLDLSLKGLCQEVVARTRMRVEYHGTPLPPLPDEIGISLYRIVQEALTNVLKHSQATRVKVKLEHVHGQLLVTVSDNGQGLSENTGEGIGLLGIHERLNMLGGEMILSSTPGKGTKLVVRVPWQVKASGKKVSRKAGRGH